MVASLALLAAAGRPPASGSSAASPAAATSAAPETAASRGAAHASTASGATSAAAPASATGSAAPAGAVDAEHPRDPASEAATAARVRAALCESLGSEALAIRVEVEEDLATMVGRVRSASTQAAATRIAKSVAGVRRVDNRLVPDLAGHASEAEPEEAAVPEGTVHDRILEERVRAAILDSLGIDGFRVVVAAKDGAVSLSGTVPAVGLVSKAAAAAKGARGARKVSTAGLSAPK